MGGLQRSVYENLNTGSEDTHWGGMVGEVGGLCRLPTSARESSQVSNKGGERRRLREWRFNKFAIGGTRTEKVRGKITKGGREVIFKTGEALVGVDERRGRAKTVLQQKG